MYRAIFRSNNGTKHNMGHPILLFWLTLCLWINSLLFGEDSDWVTERNTPPIEQALHLWDRVRSLQKEHHCFWSLANFWPGVPQSLVFSDSAWAMLCDPYIQVALFRPFFLHYFFSIDALWTIFDNTIEGYYAEIYMANSSELADTFIYLDI